MREGGGNLWRGPDLGPVRGHRNELFDWLGRSAGLLVLVERPRASEVLLEILLVVCKVRMSGLKEGFCLPEGEPEDPPDLLAAQSPVALPLDRERFDRQTL